MWGAILFVLLLCSIIAASASAAGVSVTERTKTYRVSGDTIQAVVKSMKRNGPVSELHGRRALGMADYRYRTNLKTKKINGRCRVTSASVALRIFYVLPKLSNRSRLRRRDHSKWRRIRSMITRHEHQHGRLYRRFANELQRSLIKLKPQGNCGRFRQLERQLRAKLEKSNANRNRRYDTIQYKPFNRRLKRFAPK